MKKLNALAQIVLTALPLVASTARSDQPPVTAYYDTKNNWFVFEWMNPDSGKKQSFYDSSNKVKPAIHAEVSSNDASGVYTYQFDVSNRSGAIQLLQKIFIPHPAAVFEAANPSTEWDSGEYRNEGTWGWYKTLGAVHGLPAGENARGFSFKSKGLPAIVTASFAGARRVKYTIPSPDNDTDAVQSSFEQVFSELKAKYPDKFTDRVQLKTVGPVDPPANFIAADFIQNLLTLEYQSLKLGWIANPGIARSFEAQLKETKKKVIACKIKTATNIVHAFINEVREAGDRNGRGEGKGSADKDNEDKREHRERLTSEGYAILYYNGKYLLTQLENKTNLNCPAAHDDDDHDSDDGKEKGR